MVYENVKRLCQERGISFFKLESECGIANGAIAKWAKNNNPAIQTAKKVADYFGITLDELYSPQTLQE